MPSRYTHLEFLRVFAEITGQPGASPNQYVDAWDQHVGICEDGYDFGVDEYWNDMRIRRRIQTILDSDNLKQFPEYSIFEQRIVAIDQRFLEVIIPDVLPDRGKYWWEKALPKHGDIEFVEDVKRMFGVEIALVG